MINTSLVTKRLLLMPYTAGMVTDQHVGWLNDLEVVRYSEQRHKRHTIETQHSYLNGFPRDSHIWLITCMVSDPEFPLRDIGTITAYRDVPNRRANMGIMIGEKSVWRRGFGFEAWDEVMRFLFSSNGIDKIEAGCMACNLPMRKLCDRSDMWQQSCVVWHFLLDGKRTDLVTYGKVNPAIGLSAD